MLTSFVMIEQTHLKSFPLGDQLKQAISDSNVDKVRATLNEAAAATATTNSENNTDSTSSSSSSSSSQRRENNNNKNALKDLLDYIPNDTRGFFHGAHADTFLMKAAMATEFSTVEDRSDPEYEESSRNKIINLLLDAMEQIGHDFLLDHLTRQDRKDGNTVLMLCAQCHTPNLSTICNYHAIFDALAKRVFPNDPNRRRAFIAAQFHQVKNNRQENAFKMMVRYSRPAPSMKFLQRIFSFITETVGGESLLATCIFEDPDVVCELLNLFPTDVDAVRSLLKIFFDLSGGSRVKYIRNVFCKTTSEGKTPLSLLISRNATVPVLDLILSEMFLGTSSENREGEGVVDGDLLFKETVSTADASGSYILETLFVQTNLTLEFIKKFVGEIRRLLGDKAVAQQLSHTPISGSNTCPLWQMLFNLVDMELVTLAGALEYQFELMQQFGIFYEQYERLAIKYRKKLVEFGVPLLSAKEIKQRKAEERSIVLVVNNNNNVNIHDSTRNKEAKKEVTKKTTRAGKKI